MRTYYRDDQVHVTSVAIWIDGCEYRYTQLDQLWRRGGSIAGRRVLCGLGVVLAAVVFRLVAGYAWWFGGLWFQVRRWATGGALSVALLAAGVLAMALLSLFAAEAVLLGVEHVRGHGRHRELWASVAGAEVLLLRTSDTARFEQVRRALARALGDHRRAVFARREQRERAQREQAQREWERREWEQRGRDGRGWG